MTELWLIISSTCFNALLNSYQYNWINDYKARVDCFGKISISDVKPEYGIEGLSLYAIVDLEKYRNMLRYCGNDRKPKEYRIEELGFVANDYALGTYQKHYGQLPTSTQIKILEKISGDNENSQKIRQAAAKLLWKLRIKIEEDLIDAE